MRTIGAGGGYILAPSHAIPGDVPAENILALIETARDAASRLTRSGRAPPW